MRIPCPHCGDRSHAEFTYGGDATQGDRGAAMDSDAAWIEYLYGRDNPRGPHREYWHHTLGCDRWIVVERDTLTHKISGSAIAGRRAAT